MFSGRSCQELELELELELERINIFSLSNTVKNV
jgi:hypothetical protein